MNMKSDLTVWSDLKLKWEIDTDSKGVPPAPSLYIRTEGVDVRQFCTIEQLKALRDMLNEIFEWKFVPSRDVAGKAMPECWVSDNGEVVYEDPNKVAA